MAAGHRTARSSLAWRVLAVNSGLMIAAVLALVLGPATVTKPVRYGEVAVLVGGVVVTVVANLVMVRRAFTPLTRLTSVMRSIDPLAPGTRVEIGRTTADVQQLADAFNDMLERLEDERRESARRVVSAQEDERRRLARELHDEIGQTLTGVLLEIDEAIRDPSSAVRLEQVRETTRRSLAELRRIGRDLRPATLAELGLLSALNSLATRFTRETGVPVVRRLPSDPPVLPPDSETVIYRVAQEALTNVARHAGAQHVILELRRDGGAFSLVVADDGCGLPPDAGAEGQGITGMRERALLVRGDLRLERSPGGGATVRLDVPLA